MVKWRKVWFTILSVGLSMMALAGTVSAGGAWD